MKGLLRNIDRILVVVSVLTLLDVGFYFGELHSLENTEQFHPYRKYIINPGIIKILTVQLGAVLVMILLLTIKVWGQKVFARYYLIVVLLMASLVLGLIPWVELWWGANFYSAAS